VAAWGGWLSIRERPTPSGIPRLAGSSVSDPRDGGRWLALGIICAAAFLARLEAILLVPVFMIAARPEMRSRPGRAVLLAGPPALTVTAYPRGTGSRSNVLPISGMVKAGW
jgi:hypothetical protein